MRRSVVLFGALLLTLALVAGPAVANGNSPVRHEPGGFAHSHHVHTGNGDCVDIASVLFVPAENGLHQGSNASSFGNHNDPDPTRGPFHGTCDDRLYPNGPLLSDLGIPPHH